ncbi:hypothetical protein F4778DRAFT_187194 [Xylariomycetidae sp. FL2044]|nr:hypothetical protein F4778DRAFT_187194 [Xylariomycetidae sp. FL2044]
MAAKDPASWDRTLRGIDWSETDWRYYEHWDEVPWGLLTDGTIDHLVKGQMIYDASYIPDDRMGPVSDALREQRARLKQSSGPAASITHDTANIFKATPRSVDRKEDRSEDYGSPPVGDDFLTVGFKFELPIAAALKVDTDPYSPDDARWLERSVGGDSPDFANSALRGIRDTLNKNSIKVIEKDHNEEDASYHQEMEELDDAVAGVVAPAALPSLTGGSAARRARLARRIEDLADQVWDIARAVLDTDKKDLHLYEERHVDAAADFIDYSRIGAITASEANQVRDRIRHRIKVERHRARRVDYHVDLPGMKPRYRLWSVSHMTHVGPVTNTQQYRNTPRFPYGGRPLAPFDNFRFLMTRLSSPVMMAGTQRIKTVLTEVMGVLQNQFRIHREMSGLPVTTAITFSRAQGLTLLQLKRFLTLYLIVQPHLAKLHRRHRSDRTAARQCGSVRECSRLGAACRQVPPQRLAGDDVFPSNVPETQVYFHDQMEDNVPTGRLFRHLGHDDENFVRAIWQVRSVEDLALALSTGSAGQRTDVMIKAVGYRRTEFDAKNRPAELQAVLERLPYALPDRYRGVVEFRPSQLTFDPVYVTDITMVYLVVLRNATSLDRDAFRNLLAELLMNPPDGVLTALSIGKATQARLRHGLRPSTRGYWEPEDSEHVEFTDPFYPPVPPSS